MPGEAGTPARPAPTPPPAPEAPDPVEPAPPRSRAGLAAFLIAALLCFLVFLALLAAEIGTRRPLIGAGAELSELATKELGIVRAAAPPVIRKSRLCIVFPFQLQIDKRNDSAAPNLRPA